MKKLIVSTITLLSVMMAVSQDLAKFNLYRPAENAGEGIAAAVKQAKMEGKNVFIQVGGNWCIWCARFNAFVTTDKSIDSLISAGFVVYHLNYSKENRNAALMEKYRFPNRFGFPVFMILNDEGELIHTQNSSYLEEGKGYSREKVIDFFKDWLPEALDPRKYDWLKTKEE